jgi:AcrR family transcriptional regulator
VEAISEATIQVLLSHGADRLTTTRVAERAGVSVGTLYQYYPNKESLLFAVLEDHLGRVTAAVETACEQASHKPLSQIIRTVVEAFVDAKMDRTDISVALYQIAANVGGPALVKKAGQRATEGVGGDVPDCARYRVATRQIRHRHDVLSDGRSDALRAGSGSVTAMVRKLREHLVLLCQSYMAAATSRRT